jgi:hypothetical protein
MPATAEQQFNSPADTLAGRNEKSAGVQRNAERAIGSHPHFRGRTNSICVECHQEALIVTGRMPSFYLKQLLQEVLRHVDGIEKIDNRVDVVCCDGLSSTAGE